MRCCCSHIGIIWANAAPPEAADRICNGAVDNASGVAVYASNWRSG